MSSKQGTREITDRIIVVDAAGRCRTVQEVSDLVRQQYLDGSWSNWMVTTRRYFCDGEQVNRNSDSEFEFPASGERLTRT
jgi:hypothetical protein